MLAVVDGDIRVTFQELADRVVVATRALIAADVQPGDRVAIWATNSLEWIVAGLATHSAGAAIVPINTRWKGSEAAYVLSASGAKMLCTAVGFLGTDTVAMLADHISTDATSTLPSLTQVVLLPGSDGVAASRLGTAPVTAWADFIAGATVVSDAEASARVNAVRPSDISDVLFTSGTTGRPKGVLMNHAQTVRQFTEWCDFAGLVEGDRYLIVNPFFHMFGYKAGWLAALLRGATIYPVPVFDVPTVLRLIETERITMFPGAPTIYRSILDHPDRANYDLSSLRVAVTGAADIPVSLIEQMRAELPFQIILTGYGLTEAGTATGSKPTDDSTTIATTAGRAMNGLDIIIADSDGNEVVRGATGELLVRGYSVMQGYLDDPVATAEAIDGNGFLHTGDLATMDERGYVRIVGRSKDMFIVGGFNVYPAEVEGTLLGHPAIGQVAVIGVPDERMGEVGMAFVVAVPGQHPDPDEIVVWGRERLANYKAPRFVTVVDALPINAAGKVIKDDLRRLVATQTAATEPTS
jgi:acyl-CoA synthetase (AMP-forming)/AMP-acid ligase II